MGKFLLAISMGVCLGNVVGRKGETVWMDRGEGDDKSEDIASYFDYVCRHGTVCFDGMEWRDAKVIQ